MTVKPIKLLLDEHIWVGLAEILVQRGYDVTHVITLAQRGIDDESVLALATAQDCAVFTNNMRDFVPLARLWYKHDQKHAGIILSTQLPPGELLKQMEQLLATLSADELYNTVRWLQEFGTS